MALDIKPTRSELLKLKVQIKLAKSGHSLLKKKRDGLILEFFELLKKAKNARLELAKTYSGAVQKLNVARVMHTDVKLQSLAFAIKQSPEINLEKKNIMGVQVPKIDPSKVRKTLMERGIGMAGSSPVIDTSIDEYEKVVEAVVVVAEAETAMKKLLSEIEKTKRRVNALEFSRIPAMEEARKFITLRLEEMERENVFRLKRIKGNG
ncbi:V-type ATP synthase subunit D [Candidatus Woesearchaeota archaeon CG10_big_fil_rev_8_21_14_0_10_45_16]|nr:MAG: V-type ATP synthase subunit D [Candidatus Woesearchaeota archaeon CG10_big_fil_rev_8_21_14_0_10_45_16]